MVRLLVCRTATSHGSYPRLWARETEHISSCHFAYDLECPQIVQQSFVDASPCPQSYKVRGSCLPLLVYRKVYTALHAAIEGKGSLDVIRTLLSSPNIEIDAANKVSCSFFTCSAIDLNVSLSQAKNMDRVKCCFDPNVGSFELDVWKCPDKRNPSLYKCACSISLNVFTPPPSPQQDSSLWEFACSA